MKSFQFDWPAFVRRELGGLEWLAPRRQRWPHTANPHLLISVGSAVRHGSVSHRWLLNLRGLPDAIERLRIVRHLEEALATGGDLLHLAAVFGISAPTAVRYATSARALLQAPAEPTR